MKELTSYIFWKSVYHHQWLYRLAWLYFFAFNKEFRNEVRIIWGCCRVECQDEYRVTWGKVLERIKDIRDMHLVINSLIKDVSHLETELKKQNKGDKKL